MTPKNIIVQSNSKNVAKSGSGPKKAARREFPLADELRQWDVYVNEKALPANLLTRKQIKALGLRLKKKARPVGLVAAIYTNRLQYKEQKALQYNYPVLGKDDLRAINRGMAAAGPLVPDALIDDLAELEQIGYATLSQVFDRPDCEDMNSPTEAQRYRVACGRFYDLFFGGSDKCEHIVLTEEGRATWKGTKPSIGQHLTGEIIVGPKRGESSNWICPDLDNHDGVNDPAHLAKVAATIQVLESFDCPLIAEINPKNGSTKIWAKTPGTLDAIQYLRFRLDKAFPGLGQIEIYPDDPQFYLPLRPDKITILDQVCPRNYKGVYDPEYVLDYLDRDGKLDGTLVIETIQRILSALPQPATPIEACEQSSQEAAGKRRPITGKAKRPKATKEPQDKLKYQGDVLWSLAQELRRVPTVEDGLQRLKDTKKYSGDWDDNLEARRRRVEWLLQNMARVFDPRKCGKSRTRKAGTPVLRWTDDLTRLMPLVSSVLKCTLAQAHAFSRSFLENLVVNPEHAYSWLMGRMEWFGIKPCLTKAANFHRLLLDHGVTTMMREWYVDGGVKHGRQYASNVDYFTPSGFSTNTSPTTPAHTTLNPILCKDDQDAPLEGPVAENLSVEDPPDTS